MKTIVSAWLICMLSISSAFAQKIYFSDLNSPLSFYGKWEGKLSCKAYGADMQLNLVIEKYRKSKDSVHVLLEKSNAAITGYNDISVPVSNGFIAIPLIPNAITGGNNCTPFNIVLSLLDSATMIGVQQETDAPACAAMEYYASKVKQQFAAATAKPQTASNAPVKSAMPIVFGNDDLSETELINQCGNKAIRGKGQLIIKLDNGQQKILKDVKPNTEEMQEPVFSGCLGNINMYLIYVRGWEWGSYKLVNALDGKEYAMSGEPLFSPDQKRFACSMASEYLGNTFEIWRYNQGTLVREIIIEPKDWAPGNVKWISNTEVAVDKELNSEDESTDKKTLGKITYVYKGEKWMKK